MHVHTRKHSHRHIQVQRVHTTGGLQPAVSCHAAKNCSQQSHAMPCHAMPCHAMLLKNCSQQSHAMLLKITKAPFPATCACHWCACMPLELFDPAVQERLQELLSADAHLKSHPNALAGVACAHFLTHWGSGKCGWRREGHGHLRIRAWQGYRQRGGWEGSRICGMGRYGG